jgi:two-component system NtrC family sensor kinase
MMPKPSEKILVADGDVGVLDLIGEQALKPQGYQVFTAAEGTSALQLALRNSPDIIITALDLPGLSGRDLLAALRSQGFESTIIALGPRGAETQALQAFRLGAKDYLGKPVREAELISSLDHALREVRLRREREQLAEKLSTANQQLEKRVKELTTIYGIGKAVTAITNLAQLFNRLVEGALFVTEGEIGWLLVTDESMGKLVLRAGKNLPNISSIRLNQPWDDGISSLLVLSGEGITLAGQALAKLRAGQVVKAAVAVPIKAKDKVIGVLVVGNRTGRPFSDRDQSMLSAVADYATISIVNARLIQGMEARVQTLQLATEEQNKAFKQKEENLQRISAQLRAPLLQARGTLDQLARGQWGALSPHQAEAVHAAIERIAALQRLVDEINPNRPAAPAPTPPR